MDREAWYSVTPEPIAKYLAVRAKMNKNENGEAISDDEQPINVLDAFGGVGGNLIQFAIECGFCLGVDSDSTKIAFMRNNARLYDLVEERDFQLI